MSRPSPNDICREAFRRAADAPKTADPQHVVDDDELLLDWSVGEISSERQAAILDHLADCPRCRKEVAAMVQAGALVFPDADEPPPPPSAPRRRRPWAKIVGSLVAVAAILLAAVGLPRLLFPTLERRLAELERTYEQGRYAEALQGAEQLLGQREKLDARTRPRLDELAERSAYQLARAELASGDFHAVLDLEDRVARRGISSPGLLSLKLQAERGQTAELALAAAGSLTHYDYDLDGRSYVAPVPTVDQTSERIDGEFQKAVADHPHGLALRLNYGQFLLDLHRWDQAKEQLTTAQELIAADRSARPQDAPELDEASGLAHVGLGLIEFELGRFESALPHFEAAVRLDPNSPVGHVNAAICLERLDRRDDARPYWREAARLTDDSRLRQRIEAWISQPRSH